MNFMSHDGWVFAEIRLGNDPRNGTDINRRVGKWKGGCPDRSGRDLGHIGL